MEMSTTYAGMDAHAATIRVAVLTAEGGRPEEWQLANEPRSVKRLAQRLKRMAPGPVVACYEAGPGGFALQRQLEAEGIECRVIAPALIPRRPGDRVKTDRRDARKLAELLRADLLTAVHPPTIDQEAVRDLCRAREDAVTDRTRARHRLAKLLLRRGIAYDGRNWTLRHRRWLLTLRFEHPAAQATFDDYLRAIEGVEERLRTLEGELARHAASSEYRDAVGLLRCFRGIDTVTAMTVLAELGDVTRFGSARQLMSSLGLTPSEHSSGARQRRGPITKTGYSHVRRLLVESAWHYRHPPRATTRRAARSWPKPWPTRRISTGSPSVSSNGTSSDRTCGRPITTRSQTPCAPPIRKVSSTRTRFTRPWMSTCEPVASAWCSYWMTPPENSCSSSATSKRSPTGSPSIS